MPKLKDALEAYSVLKDLNLTANVKFNYALVKIRRQLKQIADDFTESIQPSKEFSEYESKRRALILDYAKRDVDGKVVQIAGSDTVELDEDRKKEFYEKLSELDEQFKDAIEGRRNQVEEANKLVEKELDTEFYKIKFDDLPDTIETKVIDALIQLDVIED